LILAFLLLAVRVYGPVVKHARKYELPFLLYASVIGALVIAMSRGIILSLLGRDSTLSGRTEEWAVLTPYALRHLWLGYGYQAFWTDQDSLHAMRAIGAAIHGADSGYMDTMLQFGLVGMFLWAVLLRVSMRDMLAVFRRASVSLAAYWYLGLILATFLGSLTEGMFPSTTGLDTFGFVIACAGLRRLATGTESPSHL
jgi:O-antigen ligase